MLDRCLSGPLAPSLSRSRQFTRLASIYLRRDLIRPLTWSRRPGAGILGALATDLACPVNAWNSAHRGSSSPDPLPPRADSLPGDAPPGWIDLPAYPAITGFPALCLSSRAHLASPTYPAHRLPGGRPTRQSAPRRPWAMAQLSRRFALRPIMSPAIGEYVYPIIGLSLVSSWIRIPDA